MRSDLPIGGAYPGGGYRPPGGGLFIDAVIAMAEPVETHFLWRPQLRDPSDELMLKAAVNGQATAIVTFNGRDFGGACPVRHRYADAGRGDRRITR